MYESWKYIETEKLYMSWRLKGDICSMYSGREVKKLWEDRTLWYIDEIYINSNCSREEKMKWLSVRRNSSNSLKETKLYHSKRKLSKKEALPHHTTEWPAKLKEKAKTWKKRKRGYQHRASSACLLPTPTVEKRLETKKENWLWGGSLYYY